MSEPKYYRLKVVREYTDRKTGEVKERWDNVGVGFPMPKSGGYSLDIPLIGKILMLPPKDGEDAPEIDDQEE